MRVSRIINNSAALISLDLLSKAIPLIVFPFLVRVLGPQTYGKLGFAAAFSGFFGLLASPGFSTYATREAARDPNRVPFLVKHVVGARIGFAVNAFVLLLIFSFTVAPKDPTSRLLIVLTGLNFLVGSLDLQWIFAARSRMWTIALRGAVGQIIYAAFILVFIRHSTDVWIVPVASLLSGLVGALLLWLPARRDYAIPFPDFSPRIWTGFLSFCLIMGLASMMSLIYDQIDTVMLKYLRGDVEVGVYVASYRLMTMAMSFLPILGQVFFPLLSETAGQDAVQEKQYLRWAGYAVFGLALPIATGGFILAGPLSTFVLGSQYQGAAVLLRWLMLTVVMGPLASYFGGQLIPTGREWRYLISVAAGAVANVALNFLLIPRYGAVAAAITTAISQATVAAMNYYFVRDLPRPRLAGAIAFSVAATTFMALSLLGLQSIVTLHVVVMVVLGAMLYFMAFFVSRSLWHRMLAKTS
jgi:O-antigen/teichoic acid export membrane protein